MFSHYSELPAVHQACWEALGGWGQNGEVNEPQATIFTFRLFHSPMRKTEGQSTEREAAVQKAEVTL